MNIEFAVKSLQSFIQNVRSEARAASNGEKQLNMPQAESIRVYFRNQEEVEEAYTSAWLHRYYPKAFNWFSGFDTSTTDPLHSIGEDNIARRAGGQMNEIMGTPWGRNPKGADVRGTIGIGEDDHQVSVIMPIGMTQTMAQLAFLVSWKEGLLGMMAPEIHANPPAVALQTSREIKKGGGIIQVLKFAFPAYLLPGSEEITEKAVKAVADGADLIVISPNTAQSQRYFAIEPRFDIDTLIKLGVVAQRFTPDMRNPELMLEKTMFRARSKMRLALEPSWNMRMRIQSPGLSRASKATRAEQVA